MQTFRKEKRVYKKPKYLIKTKKILNREKILENKINNINISKVMSEILTKEFSHTNKKCKSDSEILMTFEADKNPIINKVHCGIMVNLKGIKKKPFYIGYDSNQEHKYNSNIDYTNPILLKYRNTSKRISITNNRLETLEPSEKEINFDFSYYRTMILKSYNKSKKNYYIRTEGDDIDKTYQSY